MVRTIHDWLVEQDRMLERFGYKVVNRKRKELCDRCNYRKPNLLMEYHGCSLLPITSEGEDCPYFSAVGTSYFKLTHVVG